MKQALRALFSSIGLDTAEAVSMEHVPLLRPQLLSRLDFVPRSAFLFVVPYYTGETENLSRYAASVDYHLCIRDLCEALCRGLADLYPGVHAAGYADHSPLDERAAALSLGLGLRGDHGLLIHPRYGSYVFLAALLCDLSAEQVGAVTPGAVLPCLHCGACARACPTGCLRGEDTACLSAVTQRKGDLTPREQAWMRAVNTAWGCDECQQVCPYNRTPVKTPIAAFYEDRITRLDRATLDRMDKAAFTRRAFAWRGRRVVERNLSVLEDPEDP